MEWVISLISSIGTIGGFSIIQYFMNRASEKRQNISRVNTDQFELFERMNDYLTEKFKTFKEQEEAANSRTEFHYDKIVKELTSINSSIKELRAHDSEIDRNIDNFNREVTRLQILYLLIDFKNTKSLSQRDANLELIKGLFQEYKDRYKGNSYICQIVSRVEKEHNKAKAMVIKRRNAKLKQRDEFSNSN